MDMLSIRRAFPQIAPDEKRKNQRESGVGRLDRAYPWYRVRSRNRVAATWARALTAKSERRYISRSLTHPEKKNGKRSIGNFAVGCQPRPTFPFGKVGRGKEKTQAFSAWVKNHDLQPMIDTMTCGGSWGSRRNEK